jgi:hypothetical protein
MSELDRFSGITAMAGKGRESDGVGAQGDGVISCDNALIVEA